MNSLRAVAFVWLASASTGCVVREDYDRVVADAAKAKVAADAQEQQDAAKILELQGQLAAAASMAQDRDAKLSDLATSSHNLQAQLDEATAMNQQLRGELQRLGRDVDKVLVDRGTLAKALDDAKSRLQELRTAQDAAEARAALFREFAGRFKALIDAGQIRVERRRGQLVMEVAGDLLFEAGHAEIRSVGRGALMEIARAVETTSGSATQRRFLVTCHVDDGPLGSKHFKTTWDLTTARAAAVVELFVALGVPAASLTAAGGGSFDPIVPNDTPENRAKNRRVEISLWPTPAEALAAQ